MTGSQLGPDAWAVVLLCVGLPKGRPDGGAPKPLSASELSNLAKILAGSELRRPSALMGKNEYLLCAGLGLDESQAHRIVALLARAGAMADELERLADRGIWVVARPDERYPERLRQRLGIESPAALFGAGPPALLASAGIAIVGSREAGHQDAEAAREFGRHCAIEAQTVYSGGARGVDRAAMDGALEAGGAVVAVLPDSVEFALKDATIRRYVDGQRLTMVSSYHPSEGFTAVGATGRNKMIYCFADFAIVVATASGAGGTWRGAAQALDAGWLPVYVRNDFDAPAGNQSLLEYTGRHGAKAIPLGALPNDESLVSHLNERIHRGAPATTAEALQTTFSGLGVPPPQPHIVEENGNDDGRKEPHSDVPENQLPLI